MSEPSTSTSTKTETETETETSSHSPKVDESTNESRLKIILSFWLVIILSLPIWWQTTKIERRNLPESEFEHWFSLNPCPIRFPIHLSSSLPTINKQSLKQEINKLSATLESHKTDYEDEIDIITARCFDFHLYPNIDKPHADLVIYHQQPPTSSSTATSIPITLSSSNKPKELLRRIAPLSRSSTSSSSSSSNQGKDSRVVKYSGHFKLVFSLMNEDLNELGHISQWDIRESIRVHLAPQLTTLAPLHNFTFETQILHYAPLTHPPTELNLLHGTSTDQKKLFIVEEEDLKAFINEADWSLASQVSMDPVLHFVLYIPSINHRPFKIRRKDGSLDNEGAFVRPQWGSVIIYNPENPNIEFLNITSLFKPISIFSQQLLSLLGLTSKIDQISLEAIMRKRILETTINSLNDVDVIIKLSNEQTNMRISLDVQKQLQQTLKLLESVEEELNLDGNLNKCIKDIIQVNKLTSMAIFNPKMLSLLYFPDEHKYAIYTPLFGPIFFPLVISLFKELKKYFINRKQKAEKKEKDE
ncbi:hypothetical protein CROQUDRAFT_660341 [Cronartium quercuum f. sp. fusiforme G11]|uniref:GPI transamidase component PIG-S n=1 Tax=Cronartium quercuum f. sp. fusiforme G11 TaxID=708437 RepID=A0A9P6NDL6_9BASI|nr:hypothetical protein CROQUDRAFT_660341 [Cronartium quercuum f. sp. fusiforme G11]